MSKRPPEEEESPRGPDWKDDQEAGQGDEASGPGTRPGRQLAVALSYDGDEKHRGTAPPKVVASGAGLVAEQILQIAFANDVKVREDADLVQVLSLLDVESEIPLEAFAAVAEILTYVYRANRDPTIVTEESFKSSAETPPPDINLKSRGENSDE